MGSRVGVMKVSAKRLGLNLEEYERLLQRGLKWCNRCRSWKPTAEFGSDRSRGDGKDAVCKACRYVRTGTGPGKRERVEKAAKGLSWCRQCSMWLPSREVRSGLCRSHQNEDTRSRYARDTEFAFRRRQHTHSRKRKTLPLPPEGREVLLDEFEGRCAYCSRPAETWDHIVPVSKGGDTTPGNVVPACRSCNSSKKDRDLDEWMAEKVTSTLRLLSIASSSQSAGSTDSASHAFLGPVLASATPVSFPRLCDGQPEVVQGRTKR